MHLEEQVMGEVCWSGWMLSGQSCAVRLHVRTEEEKRPLMHRDTQGVSGLCAQEDSRYVGNAEQEEGCSADGRERVDLSVTRILNPEVARPSSEGSQGFCHCCSLSGRGRDRRSSRWKCQNGI
ncbi:hypothetical protein PV04_06641 [Phialophora macrospora]|uniref:Uncharacterized protein n=1 Tax=Phialophora macrospora TaxID=1851006 RepID=A0A0D2CQG8_9EURO|nr:hypothetical protein PV04_06641 [Phialophora macrospora]